MVDSFIPNPFNKNNTVTEVAKKAELISQGIGLVGIIIKPIFLFIFFFIFSIAAKIPLTIFLIVAGLNIGAILITGIIQILSIRNVLSINTDKDVKAYISILVQSQKYSALSSAVIVSMNIVALLIVILFFNQELTSIIISTLALKYWLIILSALIVFQGINNIIRYYFIKNLTCCKSIAEADTNYAIIIQKLSLMHVLPIAMVILSAIYFIAKPPFYIILIPVALIGLYLFLRIRK